MSTGYILAAELSSAIHLPKTFYIPLCPAENSRARLYSWVGLPLRNAESRGRRPKTVNVNPLQTLSSISAGGLLDGHQCLSMSACTELGPPKLKFHMLAGCGCRN